MSGTIAERKHELLVRECDELAAMARLAARSADKGHDGLASMCIADLKTRADRIKSMYCDYRAHVEDLEACR